MLGISLRRTAALPALVAVVAVAMVCHALPVAHAFRAKVATAVIVGGPGTATGAAAMRTLMALRPHIATVQFRDQESSAAAAEAWQAEGVPAGYALHLAPAGSQSKHATGVLYSTRLVVLGQGSWQCPHNIDQRHAWVTFAGATSDLPRLTVVSIAFSRAVSTAVKQAQSLLQLLRGHLAVTRLHDAFDRVAVGGITNGRDTFGEVMEAFQHAGIGGEILPPMDSATNHNTNLARTNRNHAVIGNQALDDVETAVMTVGDAKPYPYGLVFDVRTHSPLPPGARVEDGKLLVAMPVVRSFEVNLERTKLRPALSFGGAETGGESDTPPAGGLDAEAHAEL